MSRPERRDKVRTFVLHKSITSLLMKDNSYCEWRPYPFSEIQEKLGVGRALAKAVLTELCNLKLLEKKCEVGKGNKLHYRFIGKEGCNGS